MPAAKRIFVIILFVSVLVAVILTFARSAGGGASVRAATRFAVPPDFDQRVSLSGVVTTPPPAPVFLPIARHLAPPCETHTASMRLEATATTLRVGDVVTVTATLSNHGCTALGLPQYRLMIESSEPEPVLGPDKPAPITHSRGIGPGQSDSAEFVLHAVGAGQATLTTSASFEVHLGYPGPAYWGASAAGPLVLTVTP